MKMLTKYLHNLAIRKLRNIKINLTRHSALFVNGAKATEHFVYLSPFIDFPEHYKQKELVQEQLKRRKADFDLNKLVNLWSVYDELKTKKSEYDKKKEEISKDLGKLVKSDPDGDITKKLKIQVGLLKDNIKKIKAPLWAAEEAAMVEALKLPNALHSRTPDRKKVLYTHLTQPQNKKDHLKIGKELNVINFIKNENYYLTGDAAIFEMGAKFYFSDVLKKSKFIQFSNPDFVKSLIVEGCGMDHTNPDSTFILHHNEDSKVNADSRLHLTGGGSLCSYFAYHAKNVVYAKALPLKYFSIGRQYTPSRSDENNLINVSQSTVIEVFGASKTENDLDVVLEELIELLKSSYSKLGYHFCVSLVAADKLSMWESLRISIEMYSTSLNRYVEVGHVSLSRDFISKRLMFTYVDNKQSKFPHIISGTILNVPRLLACVLEQDANFFVPEMFAVENWSVNCT